MFDQLVLQSRARNALDAVVIRKMSDKKIDNCACVTEKLFLICNQKIESNCRISEVRHVIHKRESLPQSPN